MLGKLEIKNPYQVMKNIKIKIIDGNSEVYANSYESNNSGMVDFVGVQNKSYEMSFSVTNSIAKTAINIQDVADALDISSGLNNSATQQQKVAADINSDGIINIQDVADILDFSSGLNSGSASGVLRDASKTNPFDVSNEQLIQIQAGNDLNLHAYILGDVDGSYANILETL